MEHKTQKRQNLKL